MKEWYFKLRSLGTTENMDLLEKKRIIMQNDISIWVIFTLFFIYIETIIINPSILSLVQTLGFQLIVAIPIFLNYIGKTNLARWVCILSLSAFTFLMVLVLGKHVRMEFTYFSYAITAVIFFPHYKHRLIAISFISLCFLGGEYYLFYYPTPNADSASNTIGIIVFIVTQVIIIVTMFRFDMVSQEVEKQFQKLLNVIEKKNQRLAQDQTQIQKQTKSMDSANADLEKFDYLTAQDLKNPLRNITGFIQLIQRNLKDHPDKNIHEYLTFASSSAKQMHQLIEDILSFSTLEDGELVLENIDLNDIVKQSIQNINNFIQQKNATIGFDNLPILKGNTVQMTLLFQNLIQNGIKYNNEDAPKVEISYTSLANAHVIKISDNGIGIDKEDHQKIFEMFQRLHNSQEYKGTGIGLATCMKIIQHHQGKIQVESEIGSGSSFIIQFPKKVH